MVDWSLLHFKPPVSHQEWDDYFEQYKMYPEYKQYSVCGVFKEEQGHAYRGFQKNILHRVCPQDVWKGIGAVYSCAFILLYCP